MEEMIPKIVPADKAAMELSRARWNAVAKPLYSLGLLEEAVVRISGLTAIPSYEIDKRAAVVMCSDNGVVSQGVTQTDSDVTAVVANNITHGDASVCIMGRVANVDCFAVDMGMIEPQDNELMIHRRVGAGTEDISTGAAMTKDQAIQCIQTGIDLVGELKAKGYKIITAGEMGIGNTTTSGAMAAVLLDVDPEVTVGAGAGLEAEKVDNKIDVVRRAIRVNEPDSDDPLDILMKLGGFDIGGMMGLFIGGAVHRVPIVIDGIISSVAALAAKRLCPGCEIAMLASHVSAEPAGEQVLEAIGLKPLIKAHMRLGEGTGAVAALPLLDMSYAVYRDMATFEDINIDAYEPYVDQK